MSEGRDYEKRYKLKVEDDVGVTMRDGTRLSAKIYRPEAAGRYPVLLAVSPYQHQTDSLPHSTLFLWREVGPYQWYVEAQGYVIVHVDVRGTGLSKGDYNFLDKTEQQDLFEIIEWCGKQPWSNGRVGGYGQSYYAWSQWWMGIVNPPSLKCIAPYDGAVDIYRDVMYHGGIYCDFLPWWYQMVRVNNLHRPPGKGEGKLLARDIPREYAEHNTYDDFWKERSPWERLEGDQGADIVDRPLGQDGAASARQHHRLREDRRAEEACRHRRARRVRGARPVRQDRLPREGAAAVLRPPPQDRAKPLSRARRSSCMCVAPSNSAKKRNGRSSVRRRNRSISTRRNPAR